MGHRQPCEGNISFRGVTINFRTIKDTSNRRSTQCLVDGQQTAYEIEITNHRPQDLKYEITNTSFNNHIEFTYNGQSATSWVVNDVIVAISNRKSPPNINCKADTTPNQVPIRVTQEDIVTRGRVEDSFTGKIDKGIDTIFVNV